MGNMSEAKKRDFVNQLITILKQNAQLFIDKGYDPANRIAELEEFLNETEIAEARQTEAEAAAKDATKLSQKTLDKTYREGSATVELISGLLGKDNNLLREIRKMRK
ncbi:MAG: hypothetical protein HQ522_15775 [Bacteroidetes bacterium]|nr:hypothetical protein [Bacteroidota bacterium]